MWQLVGHACWFDSGVREDERKTFLDSKTDPELLRILCDLGGTPTKKHHKSVNAHNRHYLKKDILDLSA